MYVSYSVVNANIGTCVLLSCHVSSCHCVSPDNVWWPVLSHEMSQYMGLFNSKHYFLPCHTAWRYLTTVYCFISAFTLLCITVQLQVEFSRQFTINMQHDDDGRKIMEHKIQHTVWHNAGEGAGGLRGEFGRGRGGGGGSSKEKEWNEQKF